MLILPGCSGFFVDALGILAHRMSDDEQEMCPSSSETKCKVFSFHETILSFGEPGSLGMVGRVVKKTSWRDMFIVKCIVLGKL